MAQYNNAHAALVMQLGLADRRGRPTPQPQGLTDFVLGTQNMADQLGIKLSRLEKHIPALKACGAVSRSLIGVWPDRKWVNVFIRPAVLSYFVALFARGGRL